MAMTSSNRSISESAAAEPRVLHSQREGRNKPCPCGSGSKLKLCCGRGAPPGADCRRSDAERRLSSTVQPTAPYVPDSAVVAALVEKGIDPILEAAVPSIGIQVDSNGQAQALEDAVGVIDGRRVAVVRPAAISELFFGDAQPPDFTRGPPLGYAAFFTMIERTAADYCSCTGERIRDMEFERLYSHLRRRPDGVHAHPLFSHLRAAARVYMSLRATSQAEYDAVLRRLVKSALTFAVGPTSSNYLDLALASILDPRADEHR